jgi:Uma2 family endonuclease
MATAIDPKRASRHAAEGEQRVLLHEIDWAFYEALCDRLAEQPVRLTYDRGELEIMSPSPAHERYKMFAGYFVDNLAIELEYVEGFEAFGETTWKRIALERGLEADQCYDFDPAKLATLAGRLPDRPDDPLPDLAVEIEISSSTVDKMSVYAALGIPEVWRYDGETVRFERLGEDGLYRTSETSLFLPVTPAQVAHWLGMADGMNPKAWTLLLRGWIRDELAGRA